MPSILDEPKPILHLDSRSTSVGIAPLGATIAIGNQKGGAGKTTTTVNLAAALGEMGYRVLVVDLDPSGGATYHLGVDPYAYEGAVELLAGDAEATSLAITEGMSENVGLIAARPELSHDAGSRVDHLRDALEAASATYDFILLDTPPNPKSPNTFAAYATAEWFLFVTKPDALSIRGLTEAIRDVATVRQGPNPRLEILGLLFIDVDTRSRALRETQVFIEQHEKMRPFGRVGFIPSSVFPNRAVAQGKSLFQIPAYRYKPVTLSFERVAEELALRCQDREGFLASTRETASGPTWASA
ncbi:MAG: ParA family protein [Planctomycetota bacterium]